LVAPLAAGVPVEVLARLAEDVVGSFSLPLSVVPNLRLNDRDAFVPLATEERSVAAALASAASLLRADAGIVATAAPRRAEAQILLTGVADRCAATDALNGHAGELLDAAARGHPALARAGGGPGGLEVRSIGPTVSDLLAVHLVVDVAEAMGANLVTAMAEALAPRVAELAGGVVLAAIVTNHPRGRVARAEGRVLSSELGADVAARIARLSEVAEVDPLRAVTHNKGILNGATGLALAAGQDTRAFEAAAHAHAVREGTIRPLATWRVEGAHLIGRIELPTPVGLVGGAAGVHPAVGAVLAIAGVTTAAGLSELLAAVGLAQNLAALRALVTCGITEGHRRLEREPPP
jgi:hydroxymethylglutaryl-CoA reductase